MKQVLTFTNLFPSRLQPSHGRFVLDRMQRVTEALGCTWKVVHPVPQVPRLLRHGVYQTFAQMPDIEQVGDAVVYHVPYPHIPGFSLRKQAQRMRTACTPVVQRLANDARTVIDAHYFYPDGVAALQIAGELGLPAVVTARGTDVNLLPERPAVARQIREVAGDAAALLTVCDALSSRLVEVTGLPRERVRTARNGVDLELFHPGDRDEARSELGLPLDRQLLLGVGSLIPRKGFHHLIESQQAADTTIVLVGEGPEQKRLERMLPPERLMFLGALPHERLCTAYQACDLFVLPSSREGWPNVVTEAIACGCPVVASEAWGIPEILTDPNLSTLVPHGDTAALGQAIQAMLVEPPARERVRAFAERYAWQPVVTMLSELFEELLS